MMHNLGNYIGGHVLVNNKCSIMAKTLQLVHMIWGFISICFLKFWTYVRKGQKQSNEVGDILKWQREEVTKLQEILKGEQVLNKKQCANLVEKLDQVVLHVNVMIISTEETSNKFGLVLEELHRIIQKVRILVQDCTMQKWCHAATFQMNNTESFRELVNDLQCFWDAICTRHLVLYSDSLNHEFPHIDFNVATYDEIESDEEVLAKRLEKRLHTMPNDSEDYELAKHLSRRLHFELRQVKGAELDALEVPKDVMKPVFLKPIGFGAACTVYESRWLGLQSATKMLKFLPNFRKEAGILACLSHPNLIKFICCGRFNEIHEGNLDGSHNVSSNLFIVLELMEISLGDLLKKQKTPLPYLVAIDIMHEIARGMCYLHDMHVAHLDLKPNNVLLSSTSRPIGVKGNIGYDYVKLTDYDISKTEVQSAPVLQTYTIGTPKYMAPEMNNKNRNQASNLACPFKADVWSFAMTCSEILSLKEPFLDTQSMKDIGQIIKDGFRPKLPINCNELTMLINECWVEKSSHRPTFSDICKRLTILKKKFMVGTYPNDIPQFDKDGTPPLDTQLKVEEWRTRLEVVVGLESNLARVRNNLKQVNILGLIGMGGIGKTTLAKAIFDDVGSTYNVSCFVENMKSKNSIDILHEIIQCFGRDKEITWKLVDAQKTMRELLASKKVLLILDDPRDATQVNEIILPDVHGVNNGTKIIITTRDWGVIENCVEVKGKIDVDNLDGIAAKKLFDSHVIFDGAHLPPQLLYLHDKIIEQCNGLPLSLKVMGAFLRGHERIRIWERAFQRLKRGRCLDGDERLWSTLRVSFDGLRNIEKDMFLDIACFFPMGMHKAKALHICTNYGTSPKHVLDILLDKSLVKINEEGFLEMHDQLRDMGRMIVETNEDFLGTRIWNKHMIPLGIKSTIDKNYKKVEAIVLHEEFLQWFVDICTGIKDLDVSSLRLLIWWRLITLPKRLDNLTSLTTLYLFQCWGLTTLPEELERLTSLTTFCLQGCWNLTTLPKELGNLTSLTTFDLQGCSSLTSLPEGLGNLTSLTTLDLQECSSLTTLPKGLGNLTSLTTLNLSRCSRLTILPKGLGNLTSLTTFDLRGCSNLITLPEGLGNFSSLTTFDLRGCASLTTLPEEFENLTSLTNLVFCGCTVLTTLPKGLGNLIYLKTLDLRGCWSLTTLPKGSRNLTSLTTLQLQRCLSLTTLPQGLGNLISLTTLQLRTCSSLTTLPKGFGDLISLTTLDLHGCSSLTTILEELGNLISLTTFDVCECLSLTTLPEGLGKLTSLTTLDLRRCSSLTTLPKGLGNLIALTTLDLHGCLSLTTLPKELGNLTSLTTFDLQGCLSLTTLPEELGNLISLTTFDLQGCLNLTTLPRGLKNLTSLTTLNLSRCSKLRASPKTFKKLTSLTNVYLQEYTSLKMCPERWEFSQINIFEREDSCFNLDWNHEFEW